jgi:hypothetical protein
MLIGGLWHGAGMTFVVWGAWHALFLIVHRAWQRLSARVSWWQRAGASRMYAVASVALTHICVAVAWVFFRADSLHTAGRIVGTMWGFAGGRTGRPPFVPWQEIAMIAIGYAVCLTLPNVNDLFRRQEVGLDTYQLPEVWSWPRIEWAMVVPWAVAVGVLFAAALVAIFAAGDGTPFLYFQF